MIMIQSKDLQDIYIYIYQFFNNEKNIKWTHKKLANKFHPISLFIYLYQPPII